ncbi:MAG: GNAT family N-acetyltransferase [Janthinobacterium lividum]
MKIILFDDQPIGYIQLYSAYDFPRSRLLVDLPQSLAAFELFIGETDYLRKGLGPTILSQLLKKFCKYDYIFAYPDKENIVAIKTYEKAKFKKISEYKSEI